MNETLQCVLVASGAMHAHQVRTFLEAAGIQVTERGEALRHTHGLTVDGLGAVSIMVAPADADRARSLLASADAGAFRVADDVS